MRKSILAFLFASVLLLALVPLMEVGPAGQFHVMAQSTFPNPTNQHACPSQTGAGGGREAFRKTEGFGPLRLHILRSVSRRGRTVLSQRSRRT